jgi:peptidyl-prolyl cis-trans isomerase A (cyclophilin A)
MQKRITSVLLLTIVAAMIIGIGLQSGMADDHADNKAKDASKGKADIEVIADPSHEKMNLTAPDSFKALFKTTQGEFTVEVDRSWAPNGADRFYSLVKNGYYDGTRFFRVVEDFVVQWGIHGNPEVNAAWYDPKNKEAVNLKDDKRKKSNTVGTVVFANAGPNTRSTQLFINLSDNTRLDDEVAMRGSIFAPFGKIDAEGMKVVKKLYSDYGEPPRQLQGLLAEKGNAILDEYFPKMDAIKSATIVEDEAEEDNAE